MNLLVWIICGVSFGLIFGYFSSSPSEVLFEVSLGAITFVFGGTIASKVVPETPILDANPAKFSPGGLFVASLIGIGMFLLVRLLIL